GPGVDLQHLPGRVSARANAGGASAAGPAALRTVASTPPAPSTATTRFLRVFPITSPIHGYRPRRTAQPPWGTPRPRYRFSEAFAGSAHQARGGQGWWLVSTIWPDEAGSPSSGSRVTVIV